MHHRADTRPPRASHLLFVHLVWSGGAHRWWPHSSFVCSKGRPTGVSRQPLRAVDHCAAVVLVALDRPRYSEGSDCPRPCAVAGRPSTLSSLIARGGTGGRGAVVRARSLLALNFSIAPWVVVSRRRLREQLDSRLGARFASKAVLLKEQRGCGAVRSARFFASFLFLSGTFLPPVGSPAGGGSPWAFVAWPCRHGLWWV